MNRVQLCVTLVLLLLSVVSRAQIRFGNPDPIIAANAASDPLGGAGGGQAEPSAYRYRAFTRLTSGASVSLLGTGGQLGTNVAPRLDARIFGNYLNLTHNFTQSGFNISLNLNMVNAGAKVDYYPLRRLPLRVSPGFLYFNQNRVRGDFYAQQSATFTINNVDYTSDNANPVRGTGRLTLRGTGFTITAGMGHIVSHTHKRFTYPFEAGVVFINTPVAIVNLAGNICQVNQTNCQPAATFPTFATNLAAQVADWNRRVAPFHVYPYIEGGVAYSFTIRR
jgi:hypothetical protein